MTTRPKKSIRRGTSKRKKSTTRVTVDFPKVQHRRLKARAALAGVTLQEYIRIRVVPEEDSISDNELDSIIKKIIDENKDALKRLASK